MSNFTTTLTLDGIQIYVEGTFHKGDKGKWTMADGSPGCPPDGDRVDVIWSVERRSDYNMLIADFGSDNKITEAIENKILGNPSKYIDNY